MPNIITDKEKIEEVLTRSVDRIYPTKQALEELLSSGKQIKVYVGIDPTADYVHLGHSTNYLVLERLWKLGHKIIVLVGDFTAMIGDPSDKTAARAPLTKEQVRDNLKSFKEQIGKILDFQDLENPVDFVYNSAWLSVLDFGKLVELASHFTVQQMLERDMFEKRLKDNKPLYVHEFFYPLMQGYDSVALETDIEIGGTDQTFNMLAGRILVKTFENTFSKKEFPEDAQILNASKEDKLIDVMVNNKIVESKSEFRRLIEAGAISDYPDKKINNGNEIVGEKERKIKIGKKTFVIIKPN